MSLYLQHRESDDESYTFTHDANGSLTAEGELFSYICSATGRAYDLTEYVNDTNRQYTVNSEATVSYSYAGNQRNSRNSIWTEARDVIQNETSFYLYDGRGSVTGVAWDKSRVTAVYQYDPYGQVTLGTTDHVDFYGYNGESYNPNTGLEYLRARYYNANQGRFFQEDTYLGDITDPLTLNRYAYVKNSPLNYVDPSGHKPVNEAYDHLPGYLTGEPWNADPSPYGAGPQVEWNRRNYPELTREQSNALERIKDDISTADKLSESQDCNIIRISESDWEYLTNAVLGAFVSIIKSGGDPYRVYAEAFWKVFGIDKNLLAEGNAQAEYIEDVLVTNKTAYYVGKIVGDVVAIILGIYTMIQGIKGTVAGAIGSLAATSSGQVYIGPAGVGVTAAGIAITTTGSGVVISAFSDLNNTGNKLKEENEGDSDPYNISDESKEKWGKGTFDSTEDSLKHHFNKHGEEVGAKDIDQYVRKAEGFSQNLKGASKSYPDNGTPGAIRYTKNGKYIIIGPDGKILSYGLAR